ncbi:MAG: hypothetical protein KDC46_07685 [Thermoleophilia bacterium]|nr:hypothetical protein [Thermoleophilia bacterium]
MHADAPDRFHAFSRLVLTVSESSLEGVRTDHSFELRALHAGAEVWRSSVLHAPGGSCESGERFVGTLTTRQVIDLLDEIERSGVYEALPAMGIVPGATDAETVPLVSMRLESTTRERTVIDRAPADRSIVGDVAEAVRRRVDLAMERALSSAG